MKPGWPHVLNNNVVQQKMYLSPHLFYIFQDHIAVPVKSLHTSQQLSVVPAIDENLQHQIYVEVPHERADSVTSCFIFGVANLGVALDTGC